MPHLTLEYTSNLDDVLDAPTLLAGINAELAASGHFDEPDIKSRAIRLDDYAIGVHNAGRGFVHVRLAILSGRPPEVKQELAAAVAGALHAGVPAVDGLTIQLSAEIADLDRASYAKSIKG